MRPHLHYSSSPQYANEKNPIDAPLAGWLSGRIVIRRRAKRGGVWVPEDGLRGAQIGAATLVPFSILASGLATTLVPGPPRLALNLLCFFVNGLGVRTLHGMHEMRWDGLTRRQVDTVLDPNAAYCVDIPHSRSAEVMAAGACVLLSFPLVYLPLTQTECTAPCARFSSPPPSRGYCLRSNRTVSSLPTPSARGSRGLGSWAFCLSNLASSNSH